MRNGILCLMLVAVLAGTALLAAATPAHAAGNQDFVWGTVRSENGFYTHTKVYPLEVIEDQFFRYWVGRAEGRVFLYDPFKQMWYPPPVQYMRTTLQFRGQPVEGFVRVWGRNYQFLDKNCFFGVDGVVYEQHNKYRRVGPAGRKHRRLVRSWYVNTLTGEQSDWEPRTPEEEQAYTAQLRALPQDAFPRWAEPIGAEQPPPSTAPSSEAAAGTEEQPASEPAASDEQAKEGTSSEASDESPDEAADSDQE